jgi:capsular polysaccharide export protein
MGLSDVQRDWLPAPGTPIGATFYVRQSQPWLKHYFGVNALKSTLTPGIGGVVRWGGRIPAKTASLIAATRRLPVWYLEDGFLRSVGLGKDLTLPISIQIDDLGMPIDASRPSRLERLIAGAGEEADVQGTAVREAIVRNRLSKYNNLPHRAPRFEQTTRRRLLLVDQVAGDVSVPLAQGNAASFQRMLDDAVASGAQCVVRTHPDVMAGYRKGYLAEHAARRPGVILSADPISAASVLEAVDEVWTVSSQFGFDALLRGLPVRCYGAPFYAGWGLTDDRFSDKARDALGARRSARPGIDGLAAAALALYPVYRNTRTWEEIDVLRAVETLVAERRALQLD